MIQAVVFDFDGLIIDTETPWYEAMLAVYQEHGAHLPLETYLQCVGTSLEQFDPYLHLETCIGRSLDQPQLRQKTADLHSQLMQEVVLRPGVEDYLRQAKQLGIKIGLASSSSREWVLTFLERLDLRQHFEVIRTSNDVRRVKPDPELYLSALTALGIDPAHALAFEDSYNGLRAAKAAGMHCVIFPNTITKHLAFEGFDIRLDSMAELPLQDLITQLQQLKTA
ncbi:hypothetical protein CIG75_10045 [Tumebacillus algifaecis]|uniref:HAD family hydrolase n=1 Tax=Tumebacillus algifaecis TaxID=1214604 RepID=A0A223D1E9_9BACL|nr:HAD family hydrolase [Tumebacillus algifaecis]ASS75295.1 hypothetical protein CIG75_10045 [Tumebacillus algifaecis]